MTRDTPETQNAFTYYILLSGANKENITKKPAAAGIFNALLIVFCVFDF